MNEPTGSSPMSAEQKFAWVEYQINQAMLGNIESIACPYCGSNVMLGVEKLCCEPMGVATATLLSRLEEEEI